MNCSPEIPVNNLFSLTNHTEPEDTVKNIFKISLLSFSLLFALPTHSYVLWLIVTGTGRGVASEFFNLNLSVCEMIFTLYALVAFLRSFSSLQNQVLLNLFKFLSGNITTVRPLFQCLICVEHYLAVVHPVTFLKLKPLRYKLFCSTVVWMTGLGTSVFCIFFILSHNYVFMWFSSSQFLLFLSIQLFCLVSVLRALKHNGPGDRRRRIEENQIKRRAFYLIVIFTLTMLIIFVPFIVSGFLYIVLQEDSSVFSEFSLYGFVLGGFVPALLFLRRTGKIPFIRSLFSPN